MLSINKAKKSFRGFARAVLNEISLYLSEGDFCVLIGANGCGKSTLLKLISGEYALDSGSIKVKGDIAQVVQDINLGTVPDMTLLENFALSAARKPKLLFYSRYRSKSIEMLKELDVNLEQYIDQPLKMLSGGQRQMIATLMAINSGNQILLLDEHTAALDPKMQNMLMAYTAKKVAEYKLTTIMITHKMDDAIKYGNRLLMMHQGKIVLDIQGKEKQELKTQDLLSLFHQYEDQILTSEAGCI